MRIVANPVTNDQGERLGTAVEWTDRTTKVAVEAEVELIVAAAQEGDLSQRINLTDKHGFFEKLGLGINALIDQVEQIFNDLPEVLGTIAQGDLTQSLENAPQIIQGTVHITFQTNLLALNASVEAVRAGEQGRGFAVVATEVRNLAGPSASAAKEIKELIKDSRERVQLGAELVNESGATLSEIVNAVKKVGDIIAEIAAASAEQSAGIDQIKQAVTSMDETTQQNAALAEKTSAASASMTNKAKELNHLVARFKV